MPKLSVIGAPACGHRGTQGLHGQGAAQRPVRRACGPLPLEEVGAATLADRTQGAGELGLGERGAFGQCTAAKGATA